MTAILNIHLSDGLTASELEALGAIGRKAGRKVDEEIIEALREHVRRHRRKLAPADAQPEPAAA